MAQMDRHPGHRQETANMTSDPCDHYNVDTDPTRIQYCQMSPQPEAIPQQLQNICPKCLGRGAPMHCNSDLPHLLLCNPDFVSKNNQCFDLGSIYFLYPLASLPKMVNPEMPASIEQSELFILVTRCWSSFVFLDQ